MATVTKQRTPSFNLSESSRKVRDPLQKLRFYIRSYVITEAVSVLVIGLAALFWIGLALDYGSFLIGLDWVRDTPRGFRVIFPALGFLAVAYLTELSKTTVRQKVEEKVEPGKPRQPAVLTGGWAVLYYVLMVYSLLTFFLPSLLVLVLVKSQREKLKLFAVISAATLVIIGGVIAVVALGYGIAALGAEVVLSIVAGFLLVLGIVYPRSLKVVLGLLYVVCWIVIGVQRDRGTIGTLECAAFVLLPVAVFALAIIIKRLRYDFADDALAMVLERRFPKILGDRLITAVELADPKIAARYGYSAAMVEQTIHDAGEAVGKLDVKQVFDWKRLRRRFLGAVALSAGLYVFAAGGLIGVAAIADEKDPGLKQVTQLNDAAAIWAERTILMDNERWPTRAMVNLIGFPESGEMKIGRGADGKDAIKVDLRARIVEYAFHDKSVPACWRAATLEDLKSIDVETVGPAAFPQDWQPRDSQIGWTVDEVKLRKQRLPEKDALGQKIQAMLDAADEAAEKLSMTRTFRRLDIKGNVEVAYKTEDGQTKANQEMTARGGYEYTTTLENLTQSVTFALKSLDFRSEAFKITMVPPPRIEKLFSHESHPAYLYHLAERRDARREADPIPSTVAASTVGLLASPAGAALPATLLSLNPDRPTDDDKFYLGGRKQQRKPVTVDVVGSLRPKVETPYGSDVTLVATTSKDLITSSVRLEGRGSPLLRGVAPEVLDERTFRVTLKNVRAPLDFALEFTDTDGAKGMQELIVEPRADEAPEIRQFKPEIVRNVNNKFVITPLAVVPFSFDIKDNEGLAGIDFVYSITEAATQGEAGRKAARAAAGVGLALAGLEAPLASLPYLRVLPTTLEDRRDRVEGRVPLAHFRNQFNSQRVVTWDKLQEVLGQQQGFGREMMRTYVLKDLKDLDPHLSNHELLVDDVPFFKGLDVTQIRRWDQGIQVPLKAGPFEVQRQFDMELRLEVRDTNIDRPERGRKYAPAGVPLQFTIVSEAELLYEIGQEEQRLYDELFKAVSDLKKAMEQMQGVKFDLPVQPTPNRAVEYEAFSVRVEEVEKLVREGQRVLGKVHSDYERVLRELRTNRVQNTDRVNTVKKDIVEPLWQVQEGYYKLREGAETVSCGFPPTLSRLSALRQTLDRPLKESNRVEDEKLKLDDARFYAEKTEKELERTLKALGDVLVQMKGVVDFNEILKKAIAATQRQRESLRRIEEKKKELEEDLLNLFEPKK